MIWKNKPQLTKGIDMSIPGSIKLRYASEASAQLIIATSHALEKVARESPYALVEFLLRAQNPNYQFTSKNSETALKNYYLLKPSGEIDENIKKIADNSFEIKDNLSGSSKRLQLVNPISGGLLHEFDLEKVVPKN
jgi:hypothetical protein